MNLENRDFLGTPDYLLPTSCAFVRAIDSSAHGGQIWHYVAHSDEPLAVTRPLAVEFPTSKSPQAVLAARLTDNTDIAALYFLAESKEQLADVDAKIRLIKNLLVQVLRDAFHLSETIGGELGKWSRQLLELLPVPFPGYTRSQTAILERLKHPYNIWQQDFRESPNIVGIKNIEPPEDRRIFDAILNASKIEVTGTVGGSFQAHSVYTAKVTPVDNALPFEAVVKVAPQLKADKEVRGYFSLLPYFREIRDVMPSVPFIWPIDRGSACERVELSRYTVMTPHFGGRSLYDFILESWASDGSRDETLRSIAARLTDFTHRIRPSNGATTQRPIYYRLYESHLSDEQRGPGKRWEKTTDALRAFLPLSSQAAPTFSFMAERLVNPLWLLLNAPSENDEAKLQAFWADTSIFCCSVRYGHGDFHVGNVLYNPTDSRLTVLDFDYVGTHPEHDDAATLEASLVLAIAANTNFRVANKWKESWPDTIKYLAGRLTFEQIENNRLAHDIAHIVAAIRRTGNTTVVADRTLDYQSCLATALLRLFASHSRKMTAVEFRPVGAVALLWLGLLFESFLPKELGSQIDNVDLLQGL